MTADEMHDLRRRIGLTQREMGEEMGLSMRTYQDLENGEAEIRPRHVMLAERIALRLAVRERDPMMAPASIRREALDLADLLRNG